mmetsp:Transcript_94618/g.276582  ORF Transcript_94618/g.276582 Transcript_94618/m.276582 type:complete len:285 (-) Transcript_94618:250-1104(-)
MGTSATCVRVQANAPATQKSAYSPPPSGRSRSSGGASSFPPSALTCSPWSSMPKACSSSKARRRSSWKRPCVSRSSSGDAPRRRSAGRRAAGWRHHSVSGMPSAARRRAGTCEAMMARLKPAKSTSPAELARASPSISWISCLDSQPPPMALNAPLISSHDRTPFPSVSITRKTSISSSRSVLNSCSKKESLSIVAGNSEKHSLICCSASNGKRPPKRFISTAARAPARPLHLLASVAASEASKRANTISGGSSEAVVAPAHHLAQRSSRERSSRERYDVNVAG